MKNSEDKKIAIQKVKRRKGKRRKLHHKQDINSDLPRPPQLCTLGKKSQNFRGKIIEMHNIYPCRIYIGFAYFCHLA